MSYKVFEELWVFNSFRLTNFKDPMPCQYPDAFYVFHWSSRCLTFVVKFSIYIQKHCLFKYDQNIVTYNLYSPRQQSETKQPQTKASSNFF